MIQTRFEGPQRVLQFKQINFNFLFDDNLTCFLQVSVSQTSKAPSTSGWRNRISNKTVVVATPLPSKLPENESSQEESKPLQPQKFTNPLDFILMKEEFVKKNPPAKKTMLVKQRDIESDSDGEMSMESVMKSLKKIVKAINPKREFVSDDKKEKEKQEQQERELKTFDRKKLQENPFSRQLKSSVNRQFSMWDERMKKYSGANIVPFNSHAARWNSCQDLIEEQRIIDKKAVRERIKNRVLSSVHQALENKVDELFSYCESRDFTVKGGLQVKPLNFQLTRYSVEQGYVTAFECVEFRKRAMPDIIAHFSKDKEKTKKKSLHVKPTIHGLTDTKTERYVYGLITRTNDLWETVKPINVAVKIKTELFAPKSSPVVKVRAKVSFILMFAAVNTSPGTCGSTTSCDQHRWDDIKGCALFSVVGKNL